MDRPTSGASSAPAAGGAAWNEPPLAGAVYAPTMGGFELETAGSALQSNEILYKPIMFPWDATIDSICYRRTGASGGVGVLSTALYDSDGAGQAPSTLLAYSATQVTNLAAGIYTFTLLDPGTGLASPQPVVVNHLYWIAMKADGFNPQLWGRTITNEMPVIGFDPASGLVYAGRLAAVAYAAAWANPATAGALVQKAAANRYGIVPMVRTT